MNGCERNNEGYPTPVRLRHVSTFHYLKSTPKQALFVVTSEMRNSTFQMKSGKAPSNYGNNTEDFKAGGEGRTLEDSSRQF